MCLGQTTSRELLSCEELMALPGNLIHSQSVREAVHTCVRYLTTEGSDEPLDINQLICLRKQGIFASSRFVVDCDNYLAETVQAAKALAVTLARWTNCRGRVQITMMGTQLADMDAVTAMGFGSGSASWAYTWLTPW